MRQWVVIIRFGLLIIVLSFTITLVEAKTITVDDDGADFVKIQDAINASKNGDTIRVYEGIYHENIVVNTSINLRGNGTNNTIIRGNPTKKEDVILITAPFCTLSGFGITKSYIGGFYGGLTIVTSNNRISNISSYENDYGIILWRNHNNTISNTECIGNYRSGLHLSKVKYCTFINITGSYQKFGSGLELHNSSHNTIIENSYSKNQNDGVSIFNSPNNLFMDNTLTSNNQCGWKIHESNNIGIFNSSSSLNQEFGISIFNSNETSLQNNEICENHIGIYFHDYCRISTIKNNTIFKNKEYGIFSLGTCNIDINAEYNWWGSNSGPYHVVNNPKGKGDNISSNVDFKPWNTRFIFVDDNAQDGGEGSKERPYNTLLQALNKAGSGFAIFINNGTYKENIVINNEISLIGNGSMNTTLIGNGDNDVIKIITNNVTISGLKIINNVKSDIISGIRLESHGNLVSNCEISVSGGYGIYLFQSNNNVLDNNYIANNYAGISVLSSANNVLNNNNFLNNTDKSISLIYSNNNTLSNNSITYSIHGMFFKGANSNNLFNNICTNNLYYGIILYTSEQNIIFNNTFSNNNIVGIYLSASSNNSLTETTITSNGIGIYSESQSINNLIKDNIIKRNSEFGISAINNDVLINASNNWWGDSSGPFHSSNNSHGKGDNVTDNVLFDPWMKLSDRKIDNYNYEKTILLILLFGLIIFIIIIYLPRLDKIPQEVIIENYKPSKSNNSSRRNISSDLEDNENSEKNDIFIMKKNDDYQIQEGKKT